MDPMIKNSFFTILIYWNDNRIHLGLTKKLIFFILFPPLTVIRQTTQAPKRIKCTKPKKGETASDKITLKDP